MEEPVGGGKLGKEFGRDELDVAKEDEHLHGLVPEGEGVVEVGGDVPARGELGHEGGHVVAQQVVLDDHAHRRAALPQEGQPATFEKTATQVEATVCNSLEEGGLGGFCT